MQKFIQIVVALGYAWETFKQVSRTPTVANVEAQMRELDDRVLTRVLEERGKLEGRTSKDLN